MVVAGPVPLYANKDTLEDALVCFSATDQWLMSHKSACHILYELYCCSLLRTPYILLEN